MLYDRVFSKVVVYPAGTTAPPPIPGVRGSPLMSSPMSVMMDSTTDLSRSSSITSVGGKKRGIDLVDSGKSIPDSKVKYCYNNLASIFGITLNPAYSGICDNPRSEVCKASCNHFKLNALPSLQTVIQTMQSYRKSLMIRLRICWKNLL